MVIIHAWHREAVSFKCIVFQVSAGGVNEWASSIFQPFALE